MTPQMSVIIVSWNTKELLKNCLTTLFAQTGLEYEVFVVDNNSLDGSQEMVRHEFPLAKLLTNTKNRGFAAANNQALRIAQGEYLLLLNSDTELPDQQSLHKIYTFQQKHQAGIVGPKLIFPNGQIQPSVRAFPNFSSQALLLLKLHVLFPKLKSLKRYFANSFSYNDAQQVDQVSGACFSISRDCFSRVGLFDERFWIWFEEVDYCKRAYEEGYSVWFAPDPSIVHVGGMSFSKMIPFNRQKQFNQSLSLYAKKYFTPIQNRILSLLMPLGLFLSSWTPRQMRQHSYAQRKKS